MTSSILNSGFIANKFELWAAFLSQHDWLVTTSSQLKSCPWSASTADRHLILHNT